jgi:L-lactate dehydrogenase complex protein LldF
VKPRTRDFIPASKLALKDLALRQAIRSGAMRPHLAAADLWTETTGREELRRQAREARDRALAKLPELLVRLEEKVRARGGRVLWARDAAEANRLVLELCREQGVRLAVKSKSMVTEETGLNDALQGAGIEVVETDLGEFIIQLAGETPSHIVAPVLHKSKESIGRLLEEKLGTPPTDDAAEMMSAARRHLRDKFLSADLGISGVNFAVAETGGLCIVTNEGNGRMVTTLPRVHLAVMGLERVLESWADLATLVQLLPRQATGQRITTYVNVVHSARRAGDADGPEHLVLLILDNGRSRILNSQYADVLACIRCGACLNACPVYRTLSGHAYGWVYPGPIGSVISPLLLGLEEAPDLPMASSLCGACKDACPVDIDLPDMLVRLRRERAVRRRAGTLLRLGMRFWRWVMANSARYRLGGRLAGMALRPWASRAGTVRTGPGPMWPWTRTRDFPVPAARPFRELYRTRGEQ